jgi:hypothetical protein
MQVDTKPFLINMIDFKGKKVLLWPSMADKNKGKEVIIDDAQKADENNKIYYRKVVAEKTPDVGDSENYHHYLQHWGAGAGRKPGTGTCSAYHRRSDAQTRTVQNTARQLGSFQRTIRQRPGTTMTTHLQTTMTRNRYVKN